MLDIVQFMPYVLWVIRQSPATTLTKLSIHDLLFLTLVSLESKKALGSRDDLHEREALERSKQWFY